MSTTSFGETDGETIQQVTIRSNAGSEATIISWGAVVRDMIIAAPAGRRRVVLGLNRLQDYVDHSPHLGAIAGRFANRIAHGHFTLDGRHYQLPLNDGGRHCLHGGGKGFGQRAWRLAGYDASSVRLLLHSPDGDAGFPGELDVACTYRLLEPATLHVELVATATAPTIVNLAQHSYFNLELAADLGQGGDRSACQEGRVSSILDHDLMVNAAFFTPVDADLIPTGEIVSVTGTAYDFGTTRPIRNAGGLLYDTNFVLSSVPDPATGLAHAATLRSPKNDLTMQVHTTEPAVQFYDGAKLEIPVQGLASAHYGPHAGLCLEPQRFPDSPNRRHFTSAVLRLGEVYRQLTEYRFG